MKKKIHTHTHIVTCVRLNWQQCATNTNAYRWIQINSGKEDHKVTERGESCYRRAGQKTKTCVNVLI